MWLSNTFLLNSGQAIVTASVNGSWIHGQRPTMENVFTKVHKQVWWLVLYLFPSLYPCQGLENVNCGGHRAPGCGVCYDNAQIGSPNFNVSWKMVNQSLISHILEFVFLRVFWFSCPELRCFAVPWRLSLEMFGFCWVGEMPEVWLHVCRWPSSLFPQKIRTYFYSSNLK